jgi:hypothetical protein
MFPAKLILMAQNHEWRPHNHPNTEAIQLRDPATELQGRYTATQQDQAIGTVLVRVVIRVKNRA